SSFAVYIGLGQTYFRNKECLKALNCFRDAEQNSELNRDRAHASVWQGHCLQQLGQNDDALRALNRAATLDPLDADVWYALAICRVAAYGKTAEFEKELVKAIRIDPNSYYCALIDPHFEPVVDRLRGLCRQLNRRFHAAAQEAIQSLEVKLD